MIKCRRLSSRVDQRCCAMPSSVFYPGQFIFPRSMTVYHACSGTRVRIQARIQGVRGVYSSKSYICHCRKWSLIMTVSLSPHDG